MTNAYDNPERLGLTVVAELSADLSYEFDTLVVWRAANGDLYWAHDSGCSCPVPFEGFQTLADLGRLPDDAAEVRGIAESISPVDSGDLIKFLQATGL